VISDNCPICRDLSERAVGAIARHVRLVGKLEIAQIQLDQHAIDTLGPSIAAAEVERKQAVEEYRSHRNSHGEAVEAEAGG
jgi:hypothetical protein